MGGENSQGTGDKEQALGRALSRARSWSRRDNGRHGLCRPRPGANAFRSEPRIWVPRASCIAFVSGCLESRDTCLALAFCSLWRGGIPMRIARRARDATSDRAHRTALYLASRQLRARAGSLSRGVPCRVRTKGQKLRF